MAGIAFSFARRVSHTPGVNAVALLRQLSHRGVSRLIRHRAFAMGVCEDMALVANAPATSDMAESSSIHVAIDGRIDNHIEIRSTLLSDTHGSMCDAELTMAIYTRFGLEGLARIRGPFVAVIHDGNRGLTHLLRDPVGGRRLVYALSPGSLDVCTEIDPLLGIIDTGSVDDIALVHALSGLPMPRGRTLFHKISEVSPGEVVTVSSQSSAIHPVSALTQITPQGTTEQQWQEEFIHCLEESVRTRIDGQSTVNVMMSGGIDSTLVAGVSAGCGIPVNAWSWRFNRFSDCDERRYILAMSDKFSLRQHWVEADEFWPLRRPERLLYQDGAGPLNPFRDIKQTLYEKVSQGPNNILLTGCFGDHLHSSSGYWLKDLLRQGQLTEAARCLLLHWRNGAGWGRFPGQVLRSTLGISHLKLRPNSGAAWLTTRAKRLLRDGRELMEHGHYRHQHAGLLTGHRTAASHSGEYINAHRAGVQLRHPFRDWRVIEHILSLPESALYRPGEPKRLAKHAAANLLPACVLNGSNRANLSSLYEFGKHQRASAWQRDSDQLVQHYFGEFLSSNWTEKLSASKPGKYSEMLGWTIRSSAVAVHSKQQLALQTTHPQSVFASETRVRRAA